MRLVERFAIVCVSTTSHFIATPVSHFHKPIRIRERLARHTDNISLSKAQDLFGLFERRYATSGDYRRVEASLIDGLFYSRDERHTPSKWTNGVREHCRHALVATLARVRVNSLAHLRWLRIFKLAAF